MDPFVFLGEIITDLEIESDEKRSFKDIEKFEECGECTNCYKKCPSKAINPYRKNSNICLSYLTQKKELEDKHIKLLDGRVFGCDSCQKPCPYNENISYSPIRELHPFDFMNSDNTEELSVIGNGKFKESYLQTSCGWRGKMF